MLDTVVFFSPLMWRAADGLYIDIQGELIAGSPDSIVNMCGQVTVDQLCHSAELEKVRILKSSWWRLSITDKCPKRIAWSARLMARIYLHSFYNSCHLMIYCIRACGGFWTYGSINTVKATAPLTFVNVHSLTTRRITLLMNVPGPLSQPFPTIEVHLIMATFSSLYRVSKMSQQGKERGGGGISRHHHHSMFYLN